MANQRFKRIVEKFPNRKYNSESKQQTHLKFRNNWKENGKRCTMEYKKSNGKVKKRKWEENQGKMELRSPRKNKIRNEKYQWIEYLLCWPRSKIMVLLQESWKIYLFCVRALCLLFASSLVFGWPWNWKWEMKWNKPSKPISPSFCLTSLSGFK